MTKWKAKAASLKLVVSRLLILLDPSLLLWKSVLNGRVLLDELCRR
jgi:hypothetical protein